PSRCARRINSCQARERYTPCPARMAGRRAWISRLHAALTAWRSKHSGWVRYSLGGRRDQDVAFRLARSAGRFRCTGPGRPVNALRSSDWTVSAVLADDSSIRLALVAERYSSTTTSPCTELSCAAPLPKAEIAT